ncbi:type VI secretion system protein TssA [Crenobacter sp. SG2305]|uniref:type VI secretion system protein TssA n=1 Tax=Crenobacter oryzisoli TaxID=3056844 RepID=UPI0025AAC955|nr:type VI secretion system protein TssA [Crenobacter sp. SG2305]MDN0083425.1 type VI secretion system protein TssA [Crenobacter sp. SG2305]
MDNLEDKFTTLMSPISANQPAGADLNYSPLFDQIREARRSDDPSLAQGEWEQELKVAEWPKVIRLIEDALATQSKDLQLVVWYIEALCHTRGFDGVCFGLDILDTWLEHYWVNGYPEFDPHDLDERIGKLEWLNSQLSQALHRVPLTALHHGGYCWNDWQQSREVENLGLKNAEAREKAIAEGKLSGELFDKSAAASGATWYQELAQLIDSAQHAYQRLDSRVVERFGDDAPSLSELRKALNDCQDVITRLLQQTGGAKPAAAPAAAPTDSPKKAAMLSAPVATAYAASAPIATGPITSRADAVWMLGEVARYFRTNEPHSPVALLAERAARWAEMSLEDWLQHVIKDDSTLHQLQELLDVKSN